MKNRNQISRRMFVTGLCLWPLHADSRHYQYALLNSVAKSHLSTIHDLIRIDASVTAIGTTYLRQHPYESDPMKLVLYLTKDIGFRLTRHVEEIALRQNFRRRCATDFDKDRIEKVLNCWLSVTELRVCALTAMVSDINSLL